MAAVPSPGGGRVSPSVFLLDSSPGNLALVAESLDGSGRLRVVGIAANRPEMYPSVRDVAPDAVIIDRLPRLDAVESFRDAVDDCGAKVVLHCATNPTVDPRWWGAVGIDAVVFKEVGRMGELIETVHALATPEVV